MLCHQDRKLLLEEEQWDVSRMTSSVGDKVHLEPTSELQLCVGPSGGLGLRDGWETGPAAQGV